MCWGPIVTSTRWTGPLCLSQWSWNTLFWAVSQQWWTAVAVSQSPSGLSVPLAVE